MCLSSLRCDRLPHVDGDGFFQVERQVVRGGLDSIRGVEVAAGAHRQGIRLALAHQGVEVFIKDRILAIRCGQAPAHTNFVGIDDAHYFQIGFELPEDATDQAVDAAAITDYAETDHRALLLYNQAQGWCEILPLPLATIVRLANNVPKKSPSRLWCVTPQSLKKLLKAVFLGSFTNWHL